MFTTPGISPDFLAATGPLSLPVPKPKGGMFGGGKVSIDPGAFLAAFAAGMGNPAGMQALQAIHQRRLDEQRQAIEQQQYARERRDKRDDFVFEQDYKAAHPGPINNDTVNDYQFILQQLGPEAATTFLKTKTNPIVMTPYGPMPYSSVAAPQAPIRPVGPLTPIEDGGPTPPASGGFPGPY